MRGHAAICRATDGRIGGRVPGLPSLLLLDHVGAKSGRSRTTPLVYMRDGENLLIVASKGGYAKDPGWLHNLRAHPDRHRCLTRRCPPVALEPAEQRELTLGVLGVGPGGRGAHSLERRREQIDSWMCSRFELRAHVGDDRLRAPPAVAASARDSEVLRHAAAGAGLGQEMLGGQIRPPGRPAAPDADLTVSGDQAVERHRL
jgi:deazaflavin-dependent oxidoreductase (nitroreductase family)